MKNLLDLIISCNNLNPTKMESSLRAFHWFIIEKFMVFDKEERKLGIKKEGLNSNYQSMELLEGEKAYEKEGNSRSKRICDGVFCINNDKSDLIMIEIKTANIIQLENDLKKQKQFIDYKDSIINNNSEWRKLLYFVFCIDSGEIKYFYYDGENKESDWVILQNQDGSNFNWIETLRKTPEEEILSFFNEKKEMVFKYEELYTALLSIYIENNNSITINNERIDVKVIGVEVNYESRKQNNWPEPLKGKDLTSSRQADLLIIDKGNIGFIIEVKAGDSAEKCQRQHYQYYCKSINDGVFEDGQPVFAYFSSNDRGFLSEIYLFSKRQSQISNKQINGIKLFYIYKAKERLKLAFETYYNSKNGNKTINGLAEQLGKNIVAKEMDPTHRC